MTPEKEFQIMGGKMYFSKDVKRPQFSFTSGRGWLLLLPPDISAEDIQTALCKTLERMRACPCPLP